MEHWVIQCRGMLEQRKCAPDLALTQAQVDLNKHTATRNAMRKKNTSAFQLDVVVRNKGRVEEWNSQLQAIIDGDSNL